MLILVGHATTPDKIKLVTSQPGDIDTHGSYVDVSVAAAPPVVQTVGNEQHTITTAATTDILAGTTTATFRRNVKTLHIRNVSSSVTNDVTVVMDAIDGSDYELFKCTLLPQDHLEYVEGVGFFKVAATSKTNVMLVTTADVVNATTSYADVTGLTWPVVTGRTYCFLVNLLVVANATTTGLRFGVNGPASPTSLRLAGLGIVTASITAPVFTNAVAAVTAYDTSVTGAIVTGPATDVWTGFSGTITPSADGTFAVRSQSEVAVANALTVRRGSWMALREADNA